MAFYDINTQKKLQKKKVKLSPEILKSSGFEKGFKQAAINAGLTEKEASDLLKQAQIMPPPNFHQMGVPSAPPQAPQPEAGGIEQILAELFSKSQSPKGQNALSGAGVGAVGGGLAGAGLGGLIGSQTGRNNKEGDKSGRNAGIGALLGGGAGALGGAALGGMQGWDQDLGFLDSIKQKMF